MAAYNVIIKYCEAPGKQAKGLLKHGGLELGEREAVHAGGDLGQTAGGVDCNIGGVDFDRRALPTKAPSKKPSMRCAPLGSAFPGAFMCVMWYSKQEARNRITITVMSVKYK